MIRIHRSVPFLVLAAAACLAEAGPVFAVQDIPPGVELETRYSLRGRQAVAVRPFAGPIPLAGVTSQVGSIVTNDLAFSDRFDMFPVPVELAVPGPVDYSQWNSLNVVYLITAELTPTADGFILGVIAHDVVFGTQKDAGTFTLPPSTSQDFRMAVHGVSDRIVQWLTGQPGMAATRIAFVRQNEESFDMLVIDSDGENLRRIMGGPAQIYSPAWSPDGQKIAYAISEPDGWKLTERDLSTGRARVLDSGRELFVTPAYSPDGRRIAYSVWLPGGLEINEVDVTGGTPRRLTDSGGDNLAPTYSPDGGRIAFLSSRTGQNHIYVMSSNGSNERALTPPGRNVEFHAPDWNPLSTRVTFHGSARGPYQVMVADADRPRVQITQLTSRGWNEDPNWAPDGRHIVYTGSGADGDGLYVIDTVTGTVRLLARGAKLRTADWSGSLAGAVMGRR